MRSNVQEKQQGALNQQEPSVARGMSLQEFARRGHGLDCVELLLQTGFEDVSQNAPNHAPNALNAASDSQANKRQKREELPPINEKCHHCQRKLERAGKTCSDCGELICQNCLHRYVDPTSSSRGRVCTGCGTTCCDPCVRQGAMR